MADSSLSKMAAPSGDGHVFTFIEFCGILVGLSGCILYRLHSIQPDPYMDEIMHIRQAKQYCDGNFTEWDPLITTLPGLYLTSVGTLKPLSWMFGWTPEVACSVLNLRGINIMFSLGNFYLLYCLMKKIHGGKKDYDDTLNLLNAFTLCVFPLLYFFTFLYYTDPGSTFFVLLMYLLSLQDSHIIAALIGFIAIVFRQTNIIWAAFVAGLKIAQEITLYVEPAKKDIPDEATQTTTFLVYSIYQLFLGLKNWSPAFKSFLFRTMQTLWPYIVLAIGFVAFVMFNEGIVVGHREFHVAVLNFPQLGYFSLFLLCFSLPHMVSVLNCFGFLHFLFSRPVTVLFFYVISVFFVWNFTYVHPFLLADNRHYTFYIWRKIFCLHELVPYILIPVYLYSFWAMLTKLNGKIIWWKVVFLCALTLATVPQKLMEFRYFIIPYLIFRLNIPQSSYKNVLIEFSLYVAVNTLTLHMFFNKPFTWENHKEAQRFMW